MARQATPTNNLHPKTLLLGVYTPRNKMLDMGAYFEEFEQLVKTLGSSYDATLFFKVRAVDKAFFLTKGHMQKAAEFCQNNNIEEVFCSEVLTPLQERNLADMLGCRVFDRTQLILDIFHNAAHTAEGKVQVEIATLEYLKTRLAGKGLELAQQEGFVGGRGPGETFKEVTRRYYERKILQARKRLRQLEQTRETQRKQRLKTKTPLISLIGYTNAGKSSLLNRLTKSDVLVENKLFATVDTTTRSLYLGEEKKILVSDTVGFISELPPHLIAAFKATLDELRYASLLLLVVDLSNSTWHDQIEIVHDILDELHIETPLLYVFNKIDLLEEGPRTTLAIAPYQPHVLVHTQSKEGIESLVEYLKNYSF